MMSREVDFDHLMVNMELWWFFQGQVDIRHEDLDSIENSAYKEEIVDKS
jgi:hypothetical protein